MSAQNYDPWKRVDELEAKVRELEARIKALEQPQPVPALLQGQQREILHLRKDKH